ncbi:hypothetical protein PENDEC_c022G01133 [Penicillium decumbens]|uniref:Uncharacterized protein n=1 Tax=Penicillium decumbens TaxID=69771 RepID=A0A1V6P1V7_PENDC|nr:hypothetical protein PENDEC_c022G01133 [Penicillium decumbens]
MAAFQQHPSATLLPPSTTHHSPLTDFCLRLPFWGAENGSFSTKPVALWPVPSRHGYKYLLPNHPLPNTLSSPRLKHHSKALPLIFRRAFFLLVVHYNVSSSVAVCSHGRRNLSAMHRRRRAYVRNHGITSESSCNSPIDTDNDRPFEPDSSETDLTEPECSPPADRTIARKKPSPNTGTRLADLSNMERVHQARYQVPDDDTDKDLA